MARILIIEDAEILGMSIQVALEEFGHDIHWCRNLERANQALEAFQPELIILDLGLPDGDGTDFCRNLRATGSIIPLIIVTARETLAARIEGLSVGADDYVVKPFELPELVARVNALYRRQKWHGPGEIRTVGRLTVDLTRRIALRDDEQLELTDTEFRLLAYLMSHPNQPLSRAELLVNVWGQSGSTQTRTVDVFIGRLRRWVEAEPSQPTVITNVRGLGYRLSMSN
ncbi:MAG: response regulator transcription factor [Myxococcota bacterium]|nr:response regulator transcription factor [Myxococcota bacterium]